MLLAVDGGHGGVGSRAALRPGTAFDATCGRRCFQRGDSASDVWRLRCGADQSEHGRDLPAGSGRDLVLNNCQNCHTFVPIVILQMEEAAWTRNGVDHRPRRDRPERRSVQYALRLSEGQLRIPLRPCRRCRRNCRHRSGLLSVVKIGTTVSIRVPRPGTKSMMKRPRRCSERSRMPVRP